MTKEQYFQLKDELKALAIQIREAKSTHKTNQRTFSKVDSEYNPNRWYWMTDGEKQALGERRQQLEIDWLRLHKNQYNSLIDKDFLREEYRSKHILYSISRGKKMYQIEPNSKKDPYRHSRFFFIKTKKLNEIYQIENFDELFNYLEETI